jgi:hypothetical protein
MTALLDGFPYVFVVKRPFSATGCHFITETPEFIDRLPHFAQSRTPFRDESRHGFLVLRDDDFLAAADSFEEISEPCLGLKRANGGHEISSERLVTD